MVRSTEFYGHDAAAQIVLAGTGEQVSIVVEGPASAFLTAAAAQPSLAERLPALGEQREMLGPTRPDRSGAG
ncbi:MAG TPA: hypothetical protein VG458_09390 [Solirubrobacterales bacterium]|nr:hypothetical protein [Solirubrobacterales bacterium]